MLPVFAVKCIALHFKHVNQFFTNLVIGIILALSRGDFLFTFSKTKNLEETVIKPKA